MMLWESKKVNEEKDKLQKEIQSLKDSIEARDQAIKTLLEIANKAEHDRARYKRRIDVLQKNQPKYIITPKIPKNITLDDLLKNTYIVENWDSSVEVIPTRAEIEKETVERILSDIRYTSDHISGREMIITETKLNEIAKQYGVEIGEN